MSDAPTDCRKCDRYHIVEVGRRLEALCGRHSLGVADKRWHLSAVKPDPECPLRRGNER